MELEWNTELASTIAEAFTCFLFFFLSGKGRVFRLFIRKEEFNI
jgi:hypothetical protein